MSKSYISILAAQAITETGNGVAVDIRQATGISDFILSADAASTDATLTVKIQDSANGTDGWADVGIAFEAVTDSGASTQVRTAHVDQLRAFVRAVSTVTGEGAATAAAVMLATKQNA